MPRIADMKQTFAPDSASPPKASGKNNAVYFHRHRENAERGDYPGLWDAEKLENKKTDERDNGKPYCRG